MSIKLISAGLFFALALLASSVIAAPSSPADELATADEALSPETAGGDDLEEGEED